MSCKCEQSKDKVVKVAIGVAAVSILVGSLAYVIYKKKDEIVKAVAEAILK